jgi:hypothetical protein
MLASAERIDAIVEMNRPGIWVFGSTQDETGDGHGRRRRVRGREPPHRNGRLRPCRCGTIWDPGRPGNSTSSFRRSPGGGFNRWTINGGLGRTPILSPSSMANATAGSSASTAATCTPMHLHSFELVRFAGKPASGIIKDVINVAPRQTAEVDFVASNPGPSLLHCHMQEHRDFGFMALVEYA